MAAQFTLTNGPWLRKLSSWIALARSSFPVPVSPWIRTAESVRATIWTEYQTLRNSWLEPIMPPKRNESASLKDSAVVAMFFTSLNRFGSLARISAASLDQIPRVRSTLKYEVCLVIWSESLAARIRASEVARLGE